MLCIFDVWMWLSAVLGNAHTQHTVHPLGNDDVEDVVTNVGSAEARLVLRQGCCGMVLVVNMLT